MSDFILLSDWEKYRHIIYPSKYYESITEFLVPRNCSGRHVPNALTGFDGLDTLASCEELIDAINDWIGANNIDINFIH